ncbi:MAG: hypothetical protein JO353_12895 [Phycisphaerae bacterium]|nr:hypothetical protein [Phycisphaerae bacterium]
MIRHALIAAGLWSEYYKEGASAAFTGELDDFPLIRLWYSSLIDLTRQEPAAERLLEGAGNLKLPAGAFFTACWLTPLGKSTAEKFLIEHPKFKQLLSSD